MASIEVVCRVRVQVGRINDRDQEKTPVNLQDLPEVSEPVRKQWARKVSDLIETSTFAEQSTAIRPCDLVLIHDGEVQALPAPDAAEEGDALYPAQFRIPPASVQSLSPTERVQRQELFALGSLLYEIATGTKPFEGASDHEVQSRYCKGEFPDDLRKLSLDVLLAILSCWSLEFRSFIQSVVTQAPKISLGERFRSYAFKNPVRCTFQGAGLLVGAAALGAPLLLGAAGFGAAGPIAGSLAAGWQSSLGAVQAGSFFAWCQSAAMGGSAVGGIWAAGAAGAGMAGLATALGAQDGETVDVDVLLSKFKEMYKRCDEKKELATLSNTENVEDEDHVDASFHAELVAAQKMGPPKL